MRILFMGTPAFAVATLEILLDGPWSVSGVVTRPDRRRGRGRQIAYNPVKDAALSHSLPLYQPESAQELADIFADPAQKPDLNVVVAFGQFLSPSVLDRPTYGTINLHPSLLPEYRGAAPMQRAIINGDRQTGVTTMYLNEGMDAGDIILQETVELPAQMTYGELTDLLAVRGSILIKETISLIAAGQALRQPQESRYLTLAPALTAEEERIDWTASADRLVNLVRGMNPLPGAYTLFKGNILKIWRAEVTNDQIGSYSPGQVAALDPKRGLTVQTGSGQLLLTEVQPAGRGVMKASDFLRGHRLTAGFWLGV